MDWIKTALGVLAVIIYGGAMVFGLGVIIKWLMGLSGALGIIGTALAAMLVLGLFALLYYLTNKHRGIW